MVPAIATGARTLASQAFKYASQNSPAIIAKAQSYAARGGADLSKLIAKKDNNSQQMALSALIKSGLDVASFTATSELTDMERRKMAALHAAVTERFRSEVDAQSASTAVEDRDDLFMEMAALSRSTGLSATEMYRLKMILPRVTSKEVELYEAKGGNRVYGQMHDNLTLGRRA